MPYKIPVITSNYVNVYKPKKDVYLGEDTKSFKKGVCYDHWIPNDFSVIKAGGEWHMIGITHPKPGGFTDAFVYDPHTIHEAEWQLFHAAAQSENLEGALKEDIFAEKPKLLYPAERNEQINEIWAPHICLFEKKYHMIYSPGSMRLATSEDLYSWKLEGALFSGSGSMRDPNILFDADRIIMSYVEQNRLEYRISPNMRNWSEKKLLYECQYRNAAFESPFLIKYEGVYYLFCCIYDGFNSAYDNRTFVFAAETLEDFEGRTPLCVLDAHAPEIIEDNGKYYIASAYYPNNGINIAELAFR
ncbi:MAG: hypothetical protein FWD23_13300 [Oscillospiraceae bacterium]|nr:hypothetical protein [Oscillospiraceae bacterium]